MPAHSEHFVFPCHRWLAKNEDDGKIERDLVPGTLFRHYANIKRLFFGDIFFFSTMVSSRFVPQNATMVVGIDSDGLSLLD